MAKDRAAASEHISFPTRVHRVLQRVHSSYSFNFLVVLLICANYILNVLDFEFPPDEDSGRSPGLVE